jgi:AcrR family transcriptional regulator
MTPTRARQSRAAATREAAGPKRRPKDRKAMIVAAACELFAERGFAAVGIKEIADRVGITGGAIYRHFADKEALLEAVAIAALGRFMFDGSEADSSDQPTSSQSIGQVVDRMVRRALDEPAWLIAYHRERYRLDRSSHPELSRFQEAWSELWSNALRDAHPKLDDIAIATRRHAVVGALAIAGDSSFAVARPALDNLLSESLLSMVVSPAVKAPRRAAPLRPWQPPRTRRDEILAAALGLFRQHGYHGVGIDQISEAIGLAGPSFYAHVSSKLEILVDAYYRANAAVDVGAEGALQGAASADEAMAGLARSYVDAAFANADLLSVAMREMHAIEAADRPMWSRRRRAIRDVWSAVLREVRPELSEGETRALVHHALPLVVNVALHRSDGRPSAPEAESLVMAFLLSEVKRSDSAR